MIDLLPRPNRRNLPASVDLRPKGSLSDDHRFQGLHCILPARGGRHPAGDRSHRAAPPAAGRRADRDRRRRQAGGKGRSQSRDQARAEAGRAKARRSAPPAPSASPGPRAEDDALAETQKQATALADLAPAKPPAAIADTGPRFDVARVDDHGEAAVIAGRAAPGAQVELLRDGKPLDTVVADASGQFVMTPPQLPAGSYELTLRAKSPDGTVTQSGRSMPVTIAEAAPPPARPAPVREAGAGSRPRSPTTNRMSWHPCRRHGAAGLGP